MQTSFIQNIDFSLYTLYMYTHSYLSSWLHGYFYTRQGDVQWLCSHGLESRSERRFRTWFGPFLIWKPDFSPCERKAVSNQAFEMRFETRKKRAFWIVIRLESLIVDWEALLWTQVVKKCALIPCISVCGQSAIAKCVFRKAKYLALHVNTDHCYRE